MQRFVAAQFIVNINMAKKLILSIVALVVLALLGRFIFLSWIGSSGVQMSERFVVQGTPTTATVADQLAKQGFIPSAGWYRIYALLNEAARHPKAGTYLLQPGLRFSLIASTLAIGTESDEVQLRVIEGWTISDITNMLNHDEGIATAAVAHSIGQSADALPFDSAWRSKFAFLKALPSNRSLEGYLFPDTYRVWKGQLPESLVQKQLAEFDQRFGTQVVTNESAPLKTLDQVVTLASIVEKEVADPEARRVVAGIFLRRLREGIPLQSDATVNYITKSGRSRATPEDLKVESAYNTYRHKGLPPGPIANPGETAIQAVLHPTPSEYRYFLTDDQGKIYYAETLEQHVANRRKAGY